MTSDPAVGSDVWAVHDAVFGDQDDEASWRGNVWDRHAAREGFRVATAYAGEVLVGFAYGHTGERGQWFSDRLTEVLDDEVSRIWVGGHFEVVTLGVLEQHRGAGVGRRLLDILTAGLPHERWLLQTTADPDEPARRLYAAAGWSVIGPGTGPGTVVMGFRRRPGSAPGCRDRSGAPRSPARRSPRTGSP
nr:GNAT family N-acetyltransferase [Nocardioides ginsengisegetis]